LLVGLFGPPVFSLKCTPPQATEVSPRFDQVTG
jgi:hypothetical protein